MENQGIWFFEQVNLFRVFCPHRVKDNTHKFVPYKRGDFIYFKQDPSTKIFLIASGKVKIFYYTEDGKEVVKAVLTKGEMFGELALLGEQQRGDFAQAVDSDTSLCPLAIEDMHGLMRENKNFSFKVYKLIGFRIQKLERKIESLISKDVKTRLVEFIKEQAEEKGKKVGDEMLIQHSFTQKDIADLIGTSRQSVTTLLNDLKDENLIHFDRKKILVRDLKKLDTILI